MGYSHSLLFILALLAVLVIAPVSAANTTVNNATVIDTGYVAYVQFEFWVCLFVLMCACFLHSLVAQRNADITAVIAFVLSVVITAISFSIEFHSVKAFLIGSDVVVQPSSYIVHPAWLILLMVGFNLVLVFNIWRAYHETYFKKISMKRRY